MTILQITQDTINSAVRAGHSPISYTPFLLTVFGFAGILLHNLIQLNRINKANGGNAKIGEYLKYEKYSIVISVIIVCICVATSQEIKQLSNAGIALGLSFVAIGYMGQSLLIFWMGKAESVIGKKVD